MQTKVFFNNSCNICRVEIDHYKKHADDTIDWVDISNNQDAEVLTSKSKSELLRRLHVIHEGKVVGGAKAFIIVWSKIPKYNFLAKVFTLKPLYIILHYLYEIIAFFLYLKNKKQLK
tara:strand:+ start:621 stop:971 length:351 start_codon:yes stop_codon:yes gene_type:complete